MDLGQGGQEDAQTRMLSVAEQTETEPHECALSALSAPLECTGKKRALLVGISKSAAEGYSELKGAHGDVDKIHRLLLEVYHYEPSAITILVDDGIEGHVQPTRRNILAAISELVKDVKAGDKLCFYYAGHSTQRPNKRSNSEEDGLDECMISLDGELIVDNELHDTLVRPLPAGSRLVAILDTCNSGSLLDLKHYRCNRVPVPWVWRGKRDSEEIRNVNVRRGARLVTLSQSTGSALQTHNTPARAPTRRSVISVMCEPPTSSAPSSRSSTGIGSPVRTGTGPSPKPGPLARLRTASKAPLARLHTLSLSIPSADKNKDQDENKEILTPSDAGHVLPPHGKMSWILSDEDARQCQSPVGQFPCNGWCRRIDGRSTVMEERDDVKADVISLASCKDSQKAWESDDGESMALRPSMLVGILRENPEQSLQDVLLRISHATHSLAVTRHTRSKAYKKQRAWLDVRIKQLVRGNQDKGYDTSDFQNPELSSPRPLDMNRPWRM
ncbi:peptidase C14, caspase domain-containing protein [Mycena albidolilacea]|uniref:Peptidase C14, caspase domain-containing protein n=1 Tax=Mycena albidolilacea TaxID=1033008 RepID=A0AAD7ACP7_9AGAR|nr:peptidase C14, caspase domain-containing protein [Mycena albidolilacea]